MYVYCSGGREPSPYAKPNHQIKLKIASTTPMSASLCAILKRGSGLYESGGVEFSAILGLLLSFEVFEVDYTGIFGDWEMVMRGNWDLCVTGGIYAHLLGVMRKKWELCGFGGGYA
ncbi:hypothetical protein [Sporosarcina sp. ACRSL]|uniref:hypothetical protein n=1 Tax=Sporosarcina sp. ACRSL TaxID=2918215 RepID=UPI001EF695CC